MSTLARRLIGERKGDETRTYTISAHPEHLDEIERFFSWINSTRCGHSGSAQMFVDGDGSASVEIKREGSDLKKLEKGGVAYSSGSKAEFKACLESQGKDAVLEVIKGSRPVEYDICPHCQQEIFEKHTYIDGDFRSGQYVDRHSDCGGAIKFPETDVNQFAEWLRPGIIEARKRHNAYLATLRQ